MLSIWSGPKFCCSSLNTILNSLPNDKILECFKLKVFVFADNKIDANEKLKVVFGRVENIVGENAGFHNVFKRFLSQGH